MDKLLTFYNFFDSELQQRWTWRRLSVVLEEIGTTKCIATDTDDTKRAPESE